MVTLTIIPDGDGALRDWLENGIDTVQVPQGSEVRLMGLDGGMVSGAPSIMFAVKMTDTSAICFETSLKLFLTAADVLKAKYGDPRL